MNWRPFFGGRRTLPSCGPTGAGESASGAAAAGANNRTLRVPEAATAPRWARTAPRTIWLTVLVENSVTGRNLRAEHGLCYYLRTEGHSLLFDTGQSGLLVENAREMGLRLEEVEGTVLSHGHYDHTGGISVMNSIAPDARWWLHPAALEPKYAGNADQSSRSVGISPESLAAIQRAEGRVEWTTRPTEILDGVFVTGEIPRQTPYEDTGGAFFLDEQCARRDSLVDDQAMFFDTLEGVVVLLGCAHAGVVNTLHYVRQITSGRPIHTVIGGMHLLQADAHRLAQTLACFRELDIKQLGPAHCTGPMPTARLRTEFADRCVVCSVGSRLAFRR
jgi:7,8-dihydropterin-6-yl-methyl-4-(beta-D-ribofuranosyl)aminobenzene 5'-phosphate synthase